MNTLTITTNNAANYILLQLDNKIVSAWPLTPDQADHIAEAYNDPATLANWEPAWNNDCDKVEDYGTPVLTIHSTGRKEGTLEKALELAKQG